MNYKTEIQKQIEKTVTKGRGYDRDNTSRIPLNCLSSDIGAQIALYNMEIVEGKQDMYSVLCLCPRIDAMVKKLNDAHLPLEVISDANAFKHAFDAAFDNPESSIPTYEIRDNTLEAYALEDIAQITELGRHKDIFESANLLPYQKMLRSKIKDKINKRSIRKSEEIIYPLDEGFLKSEQHSRDPFLNPLDIQIRKEDNWDPFNSEKIQP